MHNVDAHGTSGPLKISLPQFIVEPEMSFQQVHAIACRPCSSLIAIAGPDQCWNQRSQVFRESRAHFAATSITLY